MIFMESRPSINEIFSVIDEQCGYVPQRGGVSLLDLDNPYSSGKKNSILATRTMVTCFGCRKEMRKKDAQACQNCRTNFCSHECLEKDWKEGTHKAFCKSDSALKSHIHRFVDTNYGYVYLWDTEKKAIDVVSDDEMRLTEAVRIKVLADFEIYRQDNPIVDKLIAKHNPDLDLDNYIARLAYLE